MHEAEHLLQVAEQAARAAGTVLRDYQDRVSPREKAPADLVTDADLASQATIQEVLERAFPDFQFLGEESSQSDAGDVSWDDDSYCWIVDPLDGTTNYVHGLDNYSVSIGLRRGADLLMGIVYDPVRDQIFSAYQGRGATRNRRPIRTSHTQRVSEALVAASFSARVPPGSPEVARFLAALYRCQAVRRLGSAALNLCYVATGQLDAYWATSVKTWDVAAGILIAWEAGATASAIDGGPFEVRRPRFLASATSTLHAELLSILQEATPDS